MADKRTIKWFLDFMHTDFGQASPGDLHEAVAALNTTLGSPLAYGAWVDAESWYREVMTELATGLRHFFLKKIVPRVVEAEENLRLSSASSDVLTGKEIRREREIIPILERVDFDFQLRHSLVTDVIVSVGDMDTSGPGFRRRYAGGFEAVRFKTEVVTGFDTNGLLFQFILALNGLPASDLRLCRAEDCDKWFLRRGTDQKVFCSARCASRQGQRDNRAEIQRDPLKYEQYREGGKKRAARSYRKRIESGTPGAKVGKKLS